MNSAALIDKARGMFACLGAGLPDVYVLAADELCLPRPKCVGWAPMQGHDDHLQQHLIDCGAWHGPAPIIVLDVERLADGAASCGVTISQSVLRTALHELAHHRGWTSPAVAIAPTAAAVERALDYHNEFAALPYFDPESELPAWADDHGYGFTRAALHLCWRANAAGYEAPYGWLCAGIDYGMSPVWRYLESLGDEPQRMAGATLAEVMAARAPAAFTRLFSEDVDYWLEKRKA